MDSFYFKDLGIGKYKELSFVIRLIFTLSHGQSAVERSFSLRGNLEQHNQEEDTIISRRIIKDYLTSNKIEPYNVVIDKPLILAVKNSRLKYQQYFDEKRKLRDETMAEQRAKEAALEKKQQIKKVENDLAVINSGLQMTDKCIEQANNELGCQVHNIKMDKNKLIQSQQKLSMSLKKKSELNVELEVLTKKRKTLMEE